MASDSVASRLRAALLPWFDDVARPLPWRTTRDPYAIWISEVMSQQTRVETVIPYYERWLDRFPDVDALAAADSDDVLKLWEGLGYYSRARNLHAAARIIRERHAGTVPVTYAELRALPGVGDYTAGAVASIAGGEPRAAVDGNVRRVLSRIFDLPAPTSRELSDIAATLVPQQRAGDFNQALMELGATVCTPRTPRCARCPVTSLCAAHAAGTQLERPIPRRNAALPTFDLATAVFIAPDDCMLMVRRTAGLLRDMWSFPSRPVDASGDAERAIATIAAELGLGITMQHALGTIEHTFSHRRERYHCVIAHAATTVDVTGGVWLGDDLSAHALPRAQQRIRARARAALETSRG